jgi:hypothetical protein
MRIRIKESGATQSRRQKREMSERGEVEFTESQGYTPSTSEIPIPSILVRSQDLSFEIKREILVDHFRL